MTERKQLSKFLKLLNSHGLPIYAYKDRDTYGGHRKPCDAWFIVRGRVVCVEFKTASGKLTDHQHTALKSIEASGASVFVCTFYQFGAAFSDLHGRALYGVTWDDMKNPKLVEKLFNNFIH